jgi:hypothetical protein
VRRDSKTLRTVSVRLGEADARRLSQLRQCLDDAQPRSELAEELRRGRGRHTAYDAPVGDGETLRWAVEFALKHFPVDLAAAAYDGDDRHRHTVG